MHADAFGGQRTTCRRHFFPTTMWVLNLHLGGWASSYFFEPPNKPPFTFTFSLRFYLLLCRAVWLPVCVGLCTQVQFH